MSRRKQSKPRQIRRSVGDLNGSEDPADDVSVSEEEGGASDQEDSAECDGSSPPSFPPLYNEPRTHVSLVPDECEEDEKGLHRCSEEEEEEAEPQWNGPDDLLLSGAVDELRVLALKDLPVDTMWGPFSGSIQSEEPTDGTTNESPVMYLVCKETDCWLKRISVTSCPSESNCTIFSQGGELFCRLTQELRSGDALVANVSGSAADHSKEIRVKDEPACPAPLPAPRPSELQLLPQQAGMAAILATAVVNKDIFPCKDCGIWYRSERNLQAHLMYYCASRQKLQTAASLPQDKPKDSYPSERTCPFPQCNKSCPSTSSLEIHMRTHSGERPFVCLVCLSAFTTKANCERHLKVHTDSVSGVCHGCGFISTTRDILYSHLVTSHMVCQPGSRSEVYSPKLPLAAGLSPADSGVVLKCQVCGFSAETPALLQQHVHTHLELPAERSPTPRQSSPPSSELPDPQDGEPAACLSRPDSSSPGANGSSAISHSCSPSNHMNIKEEPRSDCEPDSKEERNVGSPQGNVTVVATSSQSTSPKSPSVVTVKAEPTSPALSSSPVHTGTEGSDVPGGATLVQQFMFNSEAAVMPQASEILAKMSEMVHSRLQQGQVSAAGQQVYPSGSPANVLKGATCFECDITFNNINNFYVHKRLYCSSRHQQGEAGGLLKEGATATAVSPATHAASPQARPVSRTSSASPCSPNPAASEPKLVDVKSEDPGLKDITCSSSSEGEGPGGGQASEGSQSPSGSAEDPDDDPTRTFCQACNIRFSRHDNYIVHKRFYCASRHDPYKQGPHSGKTAFLPQPIRTRKRKKMYEIHMAQSEALSNATTLTAATGLGLKQEAASIAALSQVSTPTRSSSPEDDGPIDLSKRPRLRENPKTSSVAALQLSDYHKCTACSISFNSIENYLAHKTYYCSATTLQPHTLGQLSRLKRPASTSPKNRAVDLHLDAKELQMGKSAAVAVAAVGPEPTTPKTAHGAKTPSTPPVVCPYCPPNRQLTCDLVEHFKTAHGLVLQQHPETQSAGVSPSPSLSPHDGPPLTPPKRSPRPHRDSVNGRSLKMEAASPSSPVCNGTLSEHQSDGVGSPKTATLAISPTRVPLTVSPMPDALREMGQLGHTPIATLVPEKAALTLSQTHTAPTMQKTPLASHLHNGNSRYCRLCNIKFSSLSNFIAHKKYYCSSHSAEHVK